MTKKAKPEPLAVVLAYPGQEAYPSMLPGGEDDISGMVGGWVEPVVIGHTPGGRDVICWVHEEGLLIGLPWNRKLPSGQPLAGPIVVTAGEIRGSEGRVVTSLTVAEAAAAIKFLNDGCTMMDPSVPASLDGFEEITGEPAISVKVVDADGTVRDPGTKKE